MCGYHLRCLNQGKNCSDCRHQQDDNNKDYLHDVLRVWPKGKEAVSATEEEVTE